MYDALEARLHDVFWDAGGECAEMPLIEAFLRQFPGTALELGCGSGRLLLPLLEKGYMVEGLDNSQDMLGLCRQRAGQHEPVLHHAEMASFQTGSTYAAIAVPAFTLQLLPYADVRKVFANIRGHLHAGGGLYLSTFIPWAEITGELDEGTWFLDHEARLDDGKAAQCHTKFHIRRMAQELVRDHRYELRDVDGGLLEKSTSTHRLTWFWPRELKELLAASGFQVERVTGDFSTDGTLDEDSQIITIVAKRCEDG
ncbi:hypothetical protein CSB20_07980 [bacterium DOLZORAL124_64_63]|nr:MAG: hypothetical protein CSB20_07980 [bacterium DOLZORAL124_64_63]